MIRRKIRIRTENGPGVLELELVFNHEDEYEATLMTIRTEYRGSRIVARGGLPEGVWADLQNRLPDRVGLTACVSCRYGNFCPAGDSPDEIFCMKDVPVTCKSDLFFYTEDREERRKRVKRLTDCCEDFMPQETGFFTYNDFYCLLKKRGSEENHDGAETAVRE